MLVFIYLDGTVSEIFDSRMTIFAANPGMWIGPDSDNGFFYCGY
jgi:hypothetical protein